MNEAVKAIRLAKWLTDHEQTLKEQGPSKSVLAKLASETLGIKITPFTLKKCLDELDMEIATKRKPRTSVRQELEETRNLLLDICGAVIFPDTVVDSYLDDDGVPAYVKQAIKANVDST